jgi:hypothetical protein
MLGPAHETLVALLRERPTLINDILRALGRRPVATGLVARDTALRVANPLEVRPDLEHRLITLHLPCCSPAARSDSGAPLDPSRIGRRAEIYCACVVLQDQAQSNQSVL